MGRIYDAMTAWFESDDWKIQANAEESYAVTAFQGRHALWNCLAQAREEQEQFVFYAVAGVRAPEAARGEVAEFLTRANYGLIMGNFEFDYGTGEIRYKTSFDAEGIADPGPLFHTCVYANVVTADRYFPGLTAVMFGGTTPEQGVAMVETVPE